MVTERDTVVTRIRKDLRERLSSLADKRNTTILSQLNKATEEFLQNNEYNFNDLLNVIEEIPTLRIHMELLKKEFEGCPSNLCKGLISIIKHKVYIV